jgi:hypothetical protein
VGLEKLRLFFMFCAMPHTFTGIEFKSSSAFIMPVLFLKKL